MDALIARLSASQTAPHLWVERLAIYREPETEYCIRTVSLRRGINVVWAREPDEGSAYAGIHAAGHGVGKTSLCLLLRYCLGDSGKAINDLRDEVLGEYPNGGTGAVVHVGDETFAVFRFFNPYREGFAAPGDDLDALLQQGGTQPFKEFEAHLAEAMLSRVSPRAIPETAQAIEWRHLLAWMARDQGARFKSFFNWREGEGTGLQRSRQDPPIVMRAVLGLLEQSESQLLTRLRTLGGELETARQELARLHQEPHLIRRRIESEVRAWLGAPTDLPIHADDLFRDSVQRTAENAKTAAAATLERLENELSVLADELGERRMKYRRLQDEYALADNEYRLLEAARTNDEAAFGALAQRREELKSLVGDCKHGRIAFQDCNHIKQEIATLGFADARDRQALEKNIGDVAARAAQALEERNRLEQPLALARQQEETKRKLIGAAQIRRDSARLELDRGSRLLGELDRWEKASGSPEAAERLKRADEHCHRIEQEIASARTRLELLRSERSGREKALNDLTDLLARALLSNEAFGALEIRDEVRPFRLSLRGGEAFRVMEVLLGDIVCLLDASDAASAFPGFLIHDCPREADMGPRPYHDFLHMIERIEREAYGDAAPFQYIVTTTTPPPESLQQEPYLRLPLDPSHDDGLLFRQRFNAIAQNGHLRAGDERP